MDKSSYLVFAQEFAQGSKKLSVSRTESTERDQPVAGRVRRACDDAPLSFPVRLCDAPYLLRPAEMARSRESPHAGGCPVSQSPDPFCPMRDFLFRLDCILCVLLLRVLG